MAVQIFDGDAAREARDEAIGRVDRHVEPNWKVAATGAVHTIARLRPEFTTDAVWGLLTAANVAPPHEERALGAIMRAAAREGWIEATDRTSKSVRPRCHARDLRVWRSLIHDRREDPC